MRRLWATGAAMLACRALGGLPAVAQESPEPSSGLPLPLVATGNGDCSVPDRGTRGTSVGLVQGAEGARDETLDCVLTMRTHVSAAAPRSPSPMTASSEAPRAGSGLPARSGQMPTAR
jgi:hypothetical protein